MACTDLHIIRRDEALQRACDALRAAGYATEFYEALAAGKEHDVIIHVTPTERTMPALRALYALGLCADEPPDPPPPRVVVAVE